MKIGRRIKVAVMLAAVILNIFAASVISYAAQEPVLNSATGIVINADTGEVLFGKDENTQYYPASITKVMTALLVMENCKMDEMVTFSKSATTNLESGATTARMSAGDKMSVRDCLYALMLKSANEVANALAEHISGSVPAFAEKMNARAKELGCTNTHFVNPNGLNNEAHLTTAHDMALIAAAAFRYEELRKIDTATIYRLPPSKLDKSGLLLNLNNKMLMKNHEKYYEYAIAGKTGYTSKAGNTLVTMAEKDGVRLVAVTMKNKKYLAHYDDTRALFEYGFDVMSQRGAASETAAETTAETATETTAETAAGTETGEPAAVVELVAP